MSSLAFNYFEPDEHESFPEKVKKYEPKPDSLDKLPTPLGKLSTSKDIENLESINSLSHALVNKPPIVREELDNEFYCVIDSVDHDKEEISARVYDVEEHIQVLEISAAFDEFLESERDKLIENAVFYWRIGTRTTIKTKNHKSYSHRESFSNFRMRLIYVSKRAVKDRVDSRVEEYSKLFN